jgi:hypothetical protein
MESGTGMDIWGLFASDDRRTGMQGVDQGQSTDYVHRSFGIPTEKFHFGGSPNKLVHMPLGSSGASRFSRIGHPGAS